MSPHPGELKKFGWPRFAGTCVDEITIFLFARKKKRRQEKKQQRQTKQMERKRKAKVRNS